MQSLYVFILLYVIIMTLIYLCGLRNKKRFKNIISTLLTLLSITIMVILTTIMILLILIINLTQFL